MDVEGLLLERQTELSRDGDGNSSPRVRKQKKMRGGNRQQKRLTSKRYKGQKKKHLGQLAGAERELSTTNEKRARNKSKKPKTPPPNAFVSVRIPSMEIHDKLKEIQGSMLATDERARHVLVPLNKLHLTLMVLRLEEEEDIKRWGAGWI